MCDDFPDAQDLVANLQAEITRLRAAVENIQMIALDNAPIAGISRNAVLIQCNQALEGQSDE